MAGRGGGVNAAGMRTNLLSWWWLSVAACGPSDPAPVAPTPGTSASIEVFKSAHVYFGDDNRRSVEAEVTLPEAGLTYERITGRFALRCPNERCDHWDRYGTFGVVSDAGTDDEVYLELDRFITPYRVGMAWETDLTDLRPVLTGPLTFRVFIDTWVGPGHAQGEGWLVDVELDFEGGDPPAREAIAVRPIWPHLSWRAGVPEEPVETQVPPVSITLPEEVSEVDMRAFVTGHGWDNRQRCAEFCAKTHFIDVGERRTRRQIWREDCEETETDGEQLGTWTLSRAGWCPGAAVRPWRAEVTAGALRTSPVDVSYHLEDFEWAGDGDQPLYYLSAVLIGYR